MRWLEGHQSVGTHRFSSTIERTTEMKKILGLAIVVAFCGISALAETPERSFSTFRNTRP
jgi:hypothetical protein